jgi:hypothetical protein
VNGLYEPGYHAVFFADPLRQLVGRRLLLATPARTRTNPLT